MAKATSVSFVNYRGATNSLALDEITVFLGKNGSGKTTTMAAILSALTGSLDPTDAVQTGTSKTSVDLKFDNGTSMGVVYTGTTKHQLNCKYVPKKDAAVVRASALGLEPEHAAEFFTEGHNILSMNPANRASFFSALDKSPIDVNSLGLTDYEKAILLTITGAPTLAYQDIAPTEKKLAAASTAANKEFAEKQGQLTAYVATSSSKPLEVLVAERDTLRKEILDRKGQDDILAKYDTEKAAFDQYIRELKDLSDKVNAGRVQQPDKGKLESQQQVLVNLHADIATLEANVKAMTESKQTFEHILQNLSTNICPISNKIICQTDRTPVKKDIEDKVAKLDEQIKNSNTRLGGMRRSETTTKAFCDKLRQDEVTYNAFVRLEEQYKLKYQNMPTEPIKPAAANAGRTLAELNDELDKLSEEIAKAENRQKVQALNAIVPELEKKAAALAKLKKLFQPNGEAYNVILRATSATYTDMMNTLAGGFGINIKYQFVVKDGLIITATGANGIEINAAQLSNGEKIITQYLLNLMINQITGNGFVFIDNIDSLDEDNLVAFFNLLKQSKNSYSNAIICGVNHPDTVKFVQGLGVQYYLL